MPAESHPTVDSLDREERALQFERFDTQTAWDLGLALVE